MFAFNKEFIAVYLLCISKLMFISMFSYPCLKYRANLYQNLCLIEWIPSQLKPGNTEPCLKYRAMFAFNKEFITVYLLCISKLMFISMLSYPCLKYWANLYQNLCLIECLIEWIPSQLKPRNTEPCLHSIRNSLLCICCVYQNLCLYPRFHIHV